MQEATRPRGQSAEAPPAAPRSPPSPASRGGSVRGGSRLFGGFAGGGGLDDDGLGQLLDLVEGLREGGRDLDGGGAGDAVPGFFQVAAGGPEADDHAEVGVLGVQPLAEVAGVGDGGGGHGRDADDV